MTDEKLKVLDLNLSWDDESIKNWAESKSKECSRLADTSPLPGFMIRELVHSYGLTFPQFCMFGLEGAIARTKSAAWWRRQARVLQARKKDQLARSLRLVHQKAQVYCSNEAVRFRRVQVARNRAILESMEATNNEADVYTLAELSDLSNSNPEIRRNELMVRMRGFEEVADELGHVGVFITTSCPSAYHPTKQIFGSSGRCVRVVKNQNYNGATPREAHAWQTKTWELARAKLSREGIRVYGFRVVEPHHDGTPHWHGLFFLEPELLDDFKAIIRAYWLREFADEAGAKKYRTKVVDIDKSRGSAAGYIAKYIAKNIDGTHIAEDLLGKPAADSAERICAWASCWGIRQFQQIGGPSVTVWRELRRIDPHEDEAIEEIRKAASDDSDWAAFCMLMGGPMGERANVPLRAARWLETNEETGEFLDCPVNRYGEDSKGCVFGLECMKTGKFILSRFYRWSIDRVGAAVESLLETFEKTEEELSDEQLDFLRGPGGGYGFT
ncbi:replication endonuclease [Pseudoteredinibacter isoporae]|uniref:replication endonuclease n=1 Tax=Pseudoteredinibacter isoporae TaxID=570281 RepID=UPI00334036FA